MTFPRREMGELKLLPLPDRQSNKDRPPGAVLTQAQQDSTAGQPFHATQGCLHDPGGL